MKKFVSFVLCALMFGSVFGMATGCGKEREESADPETEPGTVEVISRDWRRTSGFWEIRDNVFYQTQKDVSARLLYRNEVKQDYVTITVQVKLMKDGSSAGFEFRTAEEPAASDPSVTDFTVSADGFARMSFPSGSDRYGKGEKPISVQKGTWYTMRLVLNGTDAAFYVDDQLVEARSDLAIKSGREYFALLAEGEDVRLKNVTIRTFTPNNLSWEELIEASDLEKSGLDRLNATHFEYPYIGFGRTTLLVSPYGFLTPKVKRPSYIGTNYRDDPQLIYDLWWDDAIKVDPFTFSGGYEVDGRLEEGEAEEDGSCSYSQKVDISSGVLTTDLTLNVDGEYVRTKREMIVNEDGVVIIRVTSDTDKKFMFSLTTRDPVFGGLVYHQKQDGYLAECNLRTDTENHAYVRVMARSDAGFSVGADGTILFEPTAEPVTIYLAPESDLTFEEIHDPEQNAEDLVTAAAADGFETAVGKAEAWYENYYATGRVSVPDLGMAKWYVRSLFYHAVSMAGTRVPPGCYSNNVAGFFGGPCPEFDLSLSQYMLMMTNHTDLAQTTIDWYDVTRPVLRENAESGYTDKTGHSADPVEGGYLIPWIASWDGSPTHGAEVGHEQGWMSMFAGANAASFILEQAEYLNQDLTLAKDIMLGQLRMMMSFFELIDGKWVHKGVWAGGDNYSAGSFSESMAAVYSIVTIDEMRQKEPDLFTAEENAEIDEWVKRLPDMPPYGDQFTISYDPDKAMYTIGHTTADVPEMITEGTGYVGGPTNNVFFWYHLLPYDSEYLAGTLVSIAESGQLDYHFNTGWSATVAARAGLSDFAYEFTRYMLRPSSLYDDWYFTENVNDSEDFKRSPELGSHGAYVMAVSAMMFDGETDEYIKAFPAITQEWQAIGVDFTKMLAKGNLVVSGTYANGQTVVTIENRSSQDAVRDLYVRVAEGSGGAEYNGSVYDVVDGCMALIEGVVIPAGQTITLNVAGVEKDLEIDAFKGLSPAEGSDRVRTENIPFSWTLADHASSYRLVVSKYADLSTPLFDRNVGLTSLYYPLDPNEQIDLAAGTSYYWTVYAVQGEDQRQMDQGILSFKTKGGAAEEVEPLPEGSRLEAFGKTWEINQYAVAADGGIAVTSIAGYQETDPTGAYFITDQDFTVTVTVDSGDVGKFGIEILANGSYQFVRTEDGYVSSYGTLAAGGISPDAGIKVEGLVTYRLSRIKGVVTTWYKMEGDEDFTEIMSGEMPAAINGQPMRVYLSAISSYYSQNDPAACVFTDYTEEFFVPEEGEDPGEGIPDAEPVTVGETVVMDGIEWTVSDGVSVIREGDEVASMVVSSVEGRADDDPAGAWTTLTQNFTLTAKFRTYDLGKSGLLIRDSAHKYLFIRSENGVISSYGTMQDGCGSANAGSISGWIWFRISLVNGMLYTAYSTDGQDFTKVVNDISLTYAADETFELWLYAAHDQWSAPTEAAQFDEIALESSEFVPSEEEPEGEGEPVAPGQIITADGIEWIASDGVSVIRDGSSIDQIVVKSFENRAEDNPTGVWTTLTHNFTFTAKFRTYDLGKSGLLIRDSARKYIFIRSENGVISSYGTMQDGCGSANAGSISGWIWFRISLVNGVLYTAYSADGQDFTKVVNDISLTYAADETFELWLYAAHDQWSVPTEAAFFDKLLLEDASTASEIEAGDSVELGDRTFCAASPVKKEGEAYVISGAGRPDNDPAGLYLELSGDFTVTATVNLSLESGATAGFTFMDESGNYMFLRVNAQNLLESYGNLNTGASGVGGTETGFSGGEITLKAVRSGNIVTTYYCLPGSDEFVKLSALEILPELVAGSTTLKFYFSVCGGGTGTQMSILECVITQ